MLHPKLASLRNDRIINLSLSDHVRYIFCGKIWQTTFSKYRKNPCFICDDI